MGDVFPFVKRGAAAVFNKRFVPLFALSSSLLLLTAGGAWAKSYSTAHVAGSSYSGCAAGWTKCDQTYTLNSSSASWLGTKMSSLTITGFAPNVPASATVTGITIKINGRSASTAGTNEMYRLTLSTNAGATANGTSLTALAFATTYSTKSWPSGGSAVTLWGGTWTVTDVNNNLGVILQDDDAGSSALGWDLVTSSVSYAFAPVTPYASDVELSSITVSWTLPGPPRSSSGYIIRASSALASNFLWGDIRSSSTVQTALSTLTFTNISAQSLSSNTVYDIQAGALWGDSTAYAAEFTTATLANIVVNPHVEDVFVTSITANWLPRPAAPLADSCSGYILQASVNSDFSPPVFSSVTTQGVSVTTLAISGLAGNTQYYIRYGTLNNTYYVPNYYSTGAVVTTLPYPPPDTPAASAVYLSSIAVTWTPIGSPAGYLVEASTAADFTGALFSTKTVQELSGLALYDLAPQLSSNTVYNIRVGSLWGDATAYATSFATATLANIVVNPLVYGVFQTSVTANWLPRPVSPLADSCSGYILQASVNADFSPPVYSSVTTQGVSVTTLTVVGLAGGTDYYIRYGSLNNEHYVPNYYSTGAVVTTAVPAPLDPAASEVYLSSIAVTWTPVAATAGYLVEASTAADFTGTISSSKTLQELSGLTVESPQLSSNTIYNIRVGSLWGNATAYAASFATATLANIVVNPQAYGVFTTSITANWLPRPAAPLEDSCSGYILQASPNPDFSLPVYSSVTTQGVDVTTLTVTDLSTATLYYLRYGTLNTTHYVPSYYSTGTVVATFAPPPPDPAAAAVHLSSIDVTWTQIDSRAGYLVEASTAADFTGTLSSSKTVLGLSGLTVEVPQLSSNTVYNIRVGSLWGNATGYAAAFATATLANIVENPRLYAVFQTSVTANWLPRPESPLEDSCSGYIFEADTDPNFTAPLSSQTTQGPTAVTTLTVTGLEGGTQYYFRYGTLNTGYFVPNYYSTGAVAATQVRDWGNTIPTTISSGTAQAGAAGWTTPGNILAADSAWAEAPANNVQSSTVTAFGFAIPGPATILGIKVYATGKRSGGGAGSFTVSLTKDGTTSETSAYGQAFTQTSNVTVSTGTDTDRWGTTWTPAEINSGNFGVIVTPVAENKIQYYDWVGIQVYYSVPPPSDTAASTVYLSSIALTWTPSGATAGYLVQASTAADFTGTLSSSKTLQELSGLTVDAPQLSSNTVYNIRVGSLWGNATSYAAAFATATLTNIVVNPQLYGVFHTSVTANWLPRPALPLEDSCSGYILQADTDPDFTSPVSSVTTQGPVAVTTLTVTGLTAGTQYYFRFGALNTAYFVPNYYSTGTVIGTQADYVDCNLKYSPDGLSIVAFACEPFGVVTSPLRIYKAPDIWGIVLVDPADGSASKILINTADGIKAIRKYP